ncbi:hypothetical protein [Microbacterium sp. LWH12-1.2]|uniref:hypothetical protein n=1 Tax=Microbacterium sp. LWH12-1.2 TaxID=3135259 RepID=UPI003422A600
MKVTVDIPDPIGWALTDHAEKRGTDLPNLIGGLVLKAFRPKADGKAPSFRDHVEREWSKGAPDPVIAHRLGEPVEMVRVARRSLKLEPHKFDRAQWMGELSEAHPIAGAA